MKVKIVTKGATQIIKSIEEVKEDLSAASVKSDPLSKFVMMENKAEQEKNKADSDGDWSD